MYRGLLCGVCFLVCDCPRCIIKGYRTHTGVGMSSPDGYNLERAVKKVAALRKHRLSRGVTSLEVAVEHNEYKLAEFFLQNTENGGPSISTVQTNALLKEQIKILTKSPWAYQMIELLVSNHALDADKHRENGTGRTPLDVALTHGHKDVAELLLQNGADVNYIQSVGDMSPLMYAIGGRKGGEFKESMAFLLIKHGADLTYRDSNGYTVLDACNAACRMDIMQLVIAANPMDMDAFKNALRIAFMRSDVPKPDQDKLVIPRSMKARDMYDSVPLLLRAIDNADLLLLNERARDIPRDPAPERGAGGAPAAAPESPIHRAPKRSGGVDRVPTDAEWDLLFGKAGEDDFNRAFGTPGTPRDPAPGRGVRRGGERG